MTATSPRIGSIARRELVFALVLLVLGVLVLPAAVFGTGQVLFGAYEAGGLGAFYADLFAALARGGLAAWLLVLSPLGVVVLARLAWRIFRARPERRGDAPVAE